MAMNFKAPKPKPIPAAPMGPPTPDTAKAVAGALPPGPAPGPAPVNAPSPSSLLPSYNPPPGPAPAPTRPLGSTFGRPNAPSPSSLVPSPFSPPPSGVPLGPLTPPGYLASRAALASPAPSATGPTGSPYGTPPALAPTPAPPAAAPAEAPPRPLGSTFGGVGANIQNILSGVTPSRASAAAGGPAINPPYGPASGPAKFGSGMQLPPSPVDPYQQFAGDGAMNDPLRVNTQPKPNPPSATGLPLPNGGWDPALAAKSGLEQTAPGPQPSGAFPMPLFNSPTRTPTNQAFPTSPVVPPSYQQPYRMPSSAPLSGDAGLASALLGRNPGLGELYTRNRGEKPAPGPDYTPSQSPPTAQATYADRIASGGLMNNNQAAAFQKETGMQPGMTVGGRFGLNGPGVDPNSPDTLKRISDAQNVARLGNGREAVLAGLNRSGYKAPPDKQHDFGLTNSGKFNEGGQRKEPYSPSETARINDAKAKLNSPERQKYLADRKATVDARKAARAPAVQAKAMAKTESRRFRQGIMSNEDRLAFMNPAAAQQAGLGKAQIAAALSRDNMTDATNQSRIAAGERTAANRDAVLAQAGRDRLSAAAVSQGQPDPFAKPATPGAGPQGDQATQTILSATSPQAAAEAALSHLEQSNPDQAAAVRGLADSERRRVLRQFYPILGVFGY